MTHFFFFQDVMQSNVIKYMIISKQSLLNPVTMRFFALFYYVAVADEIHSYHTPKIPSFCALSQQICSVRSYIIFIPEEKLAVIVRVKNLQQFSHIPDQIGSWNIFPVEPEDAAFLG